MHLNTVPIIRIFVDDPKVEQNIVLKMNINNGEWSPELLKEFDLEVVLDAGFKEFELSGIWDDSLETDEDNFDVEAELAEIKEPVSKPGQLYQIGPHRLLCADSLDEKNVAKLMGDELADMAYMDSPFNINLNYSSGLGGKASYGGHVDDNKSDEEYGEFLRKSIANAIKFTKPDAHYFYYSDPNYVWLFQTLYRELGIKPVRVCLWLKNGLNPTPNQAFNRCYEPVIYGVKGKPYISPKVPNLTEIMNKQVATGNRQLDDILDLLDIWMIKRIAGQDYDHPTEKPITLHEKALRRCTKPGDLLIDYFGGSGSLMVSCHMLKRRCYMIEREPIFVDLILKRMRALGLEPKLISEGQHAK
jgi:DNA modification methylase